MSFHRPEIKKGRRLRDLKIKFLSLTGSPAHGEPVSILKSMNAEPAIKGKIFESENKEELDIIDSTNKENFNSASVVLEVAEIAESLESGTIKQEDAITRMREIAENANDNLYVDPSENEEKVLSYKELKEIINI